MIVRQSLNIRLKTAALSTFITLGLITISTIGATAAPTGNMQQPAATAAAAATTAAVDTIPDHPVLGQMAPDFIGTDSNGRTHHLSDYRGKYVVLEWANPECPYTRKHYSTNNMQKLQKKETDAGVIWLTIDSSAEGKEGYMNRTIATRWLKDEDAAPTALLLDPSGKIGHLYEAKTTPHMFVIDPKGILRYMGAIDNNSSASSATVAVAKNYVTSALDDMRAGKDVETPETRPYGCSVKY